MIASLNEGLRLVCITTLQVSPGKYSTRESVYRIEDPMDANQDLLCLRE